MEEIAYTLVENGLEGGYTRALPYIALMPGGGMIYHLVLMLLLRLEEEASQLRICLHALCLLCRRGGNRGMLLHSISLILWR